MKSVKRKCSRCGDPGLHLKKRPAIRTVAGHSFKASVPAQVCDSCGAVYFNGDGKCAKQHSVLVS